MNPRWRSVGTLAVAIALSCGAQDAAAMPDDPPVAAVAPDDGAAVPIDPRGVEVRYACPAGYRISGESPFATYGGRSDYGVHFASAPAVGSDGRLLQSNLVDIASPDPLPDNDLPADQCRGYLTEDLRPGVVYWQAWRICIGCAGGYETSEVRSLRLTTAGSQLRVAASWPRRAYAGFPFHVAATSSGMAAGATVELQRRSGGSWRTFGWMTVTSDAADGPASLPRGTHSVRAIVRVGAEEIASAPATVRVLQARGWTTSRSQDGRWRQRRAPTLRFSVGGGGRVVSGGSFNVSLLCPTPGMVSQFTTMLFAAPLPRARIAPDGSFAWAGAPQGHATYIHGTIRGRSASGVARLSVGTCAGSARWSARRVG